MSVAAAISSSRSRGRTIINNFHGAYPSLPIRPLGRGHSVYERPFSSCISTALRACDREFDGQSMRSCVAGVLTASGFSSIADPFVDVTGGFAYGLQFMCPLDEYGPPLALVV